MVTAQVAVCMVGQEGRELTLMTPCLQAQHTPNAAVLRLFRLFRSWSAAEERGDGLHAGFADFGQALLSRREFLRLCRKKKDGRNSRAVEERQ